MGGIGGIVEGNGRCTTCLQRHRLRQFCNDGFCLWIKKFQHSLTRKGFLTGVEHAGCDGSLITVAQEAWHVWLYHHILLGDGLIVDIAVEHILRVGDTHEAPGGQTLW